mgnify:CR=1 FL=1
MLGVWFARPGGLTPLCLPQVLVSIYDDLSLFAVNLLPNGGQNLSSFQEEMRADGEILLKSELIDPTTGSLYQLVRRMSQMAVISKQPIAQDDILVFKSLIEVYKSFYFIFFHVIIVPVLSLFIWISASQLQERAAEIVDQLRNSHWTSTCIVTISKFNAFFHGQEDSHVALCYLTQCGKARYIVDRRQDSVEVCALCCPLSAISLQEVHCGTLLHPICTFRV